MRFFSLMAALALAGPVAAADLALLIANENYANARDIRAADDLLAARGSLEEAGFEVMAAQDADAAEIRELLTQMSDKADGSGRVIVAVSGHFAGTATAGWLLGTDADAPDILTAGIQGIPLDALAGLAARAPGQAVLLLGTEDREIALGGGLSPGIVAPTAPQGVSLVIGPSDEIADYLADGILAEGESIVGSVQAYPELEARGFLAPLIPFIGGAPAVERVNPDAAERAFWQATQQIATRDGYQGYLEKYPSGLFAAQAREAITEIAEAPLRAAEAAEAALSLSRNDRRELQRALTLLEFDPRGIDGIFGPGSRAAITQFQQANGLAATGFVTQDMLDRLRVQAERRNAELEAEAERRRIELERQDRAYWAATGALGDEAGLRAYLERYPDGVFAEIAAVRLKPFEEARREAAAQQDRTDWDAATSLDTIAAYQGYLQTNPEGAFAAEATARINELDFASRNAQALQAAERNEARLGMNDATRKLVEDRLMRLGLQPGPIDGTFDERTRRAIRRYQEARRLQKTGYLNQATAVRLLADSVLQ